MAGTVQTVSFYHGDNSTSTISALFTVVLATTGTTQIDLPFHNPTVWTDGILIRKSATGSVVNATIQYR